MKKVIATLGLALASVIAVQAQNAHEAIVKYDKIQANGVVAEYDRPKSVIEEALKKELEKEGLGKSKSSKGYDLYAGTTWSNISTDKVDAYFKVEGKKNKSTVTVLISKGYDNFVNANSDMATIENVKKFLNNLNVGADKVQLGLDIKAQEEVVKKAEKNYNNSVNDGKSLLSDKEKIEKKIAENNTDQQQKQNALNETKAKLDQLKASNN
jgi:hypothetical protein